MTAFTFEHNGKTFELPDPNTFKAGALRKSRKGIDPADKMFTLLEEVLGEDSEVLAAIDDMEAEELNEIVNGWLKGVSLGESSSSSS
jgi:hypothetical protein